jgi:hypothetical protein
LSLVIFGKEIEFNNKKKEGAVFIVVDKEVFISKVTKQGIVFSLGCFSLLYPL